MNILLIIPAYNEEENIVRVISELEKNYPSYDYIIINDGSRDNTERICKENNYYCINVPVNVGLMAGFRIGMKYAKRYGYDMVVQLDGDGQHNPEYIDAMAQEINECNADIVIGSRFLRGKDNRSLRMLGSKILKGLIYFTTQKSVSDPTSGMRAYNKKCIDYFAENSNCGPEPDSLVHFLKMGYKVKEVPVEMKERMGGESYLNWSRSVEYMFTMCTSILMVESFWRK